MSLYKVLWLTYEKPMKSLFNLSLLFLALFTFGEKSHSLSDYEIKKFCKKEKKESTCIKILKENRSNLNKGNSIEIPVIPYRE